MFENSEVKIYLVEQFPTDNIILLNQRDIYYKLNKNKKNKKHQRLKLIVFENSY